MPPDRLQLHASCVAINGKALLILGISGSGKSDLALRLIDRGGVLISDDQVIIENSGGKLLASPAGTIEGMLEARGIGILHLPYAAKAPLVLGVKLVPSDDIERMPASQFFDCLGHKVPLLSLNAFEHSTPAKIRFFLTTL